MCKLNISAFKTRKNLQDIKYMSIVKQLNSSSYLPASYTERLSSTSDGDCSLPHTWKSGWTEKKKLIIAFQLTYIWYNLKI